MATQLETLFAQESEFLVAGDMPSFASSYSDMGTASQATTDWTSLVLSGLGKYVDLELKQRYSPTSTAPRTEGGAVAGKTALSLSTAAPMLIGAGLVLAVIVFALRK